MMKRILLGFLLVLALVLPLAAQEDSLDTLTEDNTVFLMGTLRVDETTGDIVMDYTDEVTGESGSYIIAPASAFVPSRIQPDEVVIIIGRLLPDGITVQAMEFEYFVEEEPEMTPEPDAEMTPEPEMTEEPEPEMTAEPEMTEEPEMTAEPVTCGNTNHPVAAELASAFDISADEVMAMHCAGNGFGNIARALALAAADEDGANAQDFLDRHHGGQGWGQIVQESGVNPSELAPGQQKKNQGDDDTTDAVTESSTQPGNSNRGNSGNNGNGNDGNNGRGNDNDGNNGRGNGNNGNNGNGNNKGGKGK